MQSLVIIGHGSHLNPDAADPTYAHTDRIRSLQVFDEVQEAFWKEEPHLREVLRMIRADEVFVVPLFISEGYFTETVIPRELRLTDWHTEQWDSDGISASVSTHTPADVDKSVHYCGPVGTHDSMTDVIVERAEAIVDGQVPTDSLGLAVVGHGTERNENSAKAIEYHVDRLGDRGIFAETHALFMDEDPRINDLVSHFEAEHIVVVPLFIANGYHTQEDIPEDVGLVENGRTDWDVPADVDDRKVYYTGAVGTDPRVATVILERTRDAGARIDVDVSSGDEFGGIVTPNR